MKIKALFFSVCLFIVQLSIGQINLTQGLVGYFPFNGNANDLSTIAINGTVNNATLSTGLDGSLNGSYQYNSASNSYINFGTDNRSVTDEVTISLWVKTTNSGPDQMIVAKYNYLVDKGFEIALHGSTGRVITAGRDGSGTYYTSGYSTTAINDGNWHHVMGVVHGNVWEIWVDCVLENSFTTSTINPDFTNNEPLTTGMWFSGNGAGNYHYFDGSIDELRIYNRLLNSDEKSFLCTYCEVVGSTVTDFSNGLVAAYSFTGNANDNSTYANHGVNNGATLVNGLDGSANSAYEFVSSQQDYINFGTDNRGVTDEVSISLWVKTTNTTADQMIVAKYNYVVDKGYEIAIQGSTGRVITAGRDGSGTYYTSGYSTTVINDGNWHHVLGVVRGNVWEIWVDCELENSFTTSTVNPDLTNNEPLTIGMWFSGNGAGNFHYFDGVVDEVRFYNRELNSCEIELMCDSSIINSVDEIKPIAFEFDLFPNPATQIVNIETAYSKTFSVLIYDMTGRLVYSAVNEKQIDISKLDNGTYLIYMTDESKQIISEIKKFVKI